MALEGVIFDLDGTLLDTLEDISDALNGVLLNRGYPTHTVQAVKDFIGSGVGVLIERALPVSARDKKTVKECVGEFKTRYSSSWAINTRIYCGVKELLDLLAKEKLKTAILSNKPHKFTELCVEHFFSNWKFDLVLGQREGVAHKPDPAAALEIAQELKINPSNTLFIGDSAIDMKTAVAAKMRPVGALWGFRSEEELRSGGAEQLIEHPSQLFPLIR